MAVTTKKLLQSPIARQLQSASGTFNLLNCASADQQQRHASSHSENTNTFIKEVSIATILQIHT
jgi:hypothetical protein